MVILGGWEDNLHWWVEECDALQALSPSKLALSLRILVYLVILVYVLFFIY